MARRKKKNKKIKLLLIFLLITFAIYYLVIHDDIHENIKDFSDSVIGDVNPSKIKIVDEDSKTRPVAVMINNNHAAWPHAGLQDAYITYEIIAEGGITRMMAIFKDKDTSKIGSVRSSRPYYLDYALENDAIYVHFGWSEQAREDIEKLGIDNINGLYDSAAFWRDTSSGKALEHTAFTSMEKIKQVIQNKGYDRDMDKKLLLKYSVKEVDLSSMDEAFRTDSIFIKYSYYHNVSYEYDSENKIYKRSMSGTKHVDAISGQQYTYKNILITPIQNNSYDDYGRQQLNNIGSGDGYFITNGYAVPITWSKASRSSQTVYKYLNGKEIEVNDGNTFIQITPVHEEIRIDGN